MHTFPCAVMDSDRTAAVAAFDMHIFCKLAAHLWSMRPGGYELSGVPLGMVARRVEQSCCSHAPPFSHAHRPASVDGLLDAHVARGRTATPHGGNPSKHEHPKPSSGHFRVFVEALDMSVSVSISRTETLDDPSITSHLDLSKSPKTGSKYTVYVVAVSADGCVWFVNKRYSEFRSLHLTLSEKPYSIKVRCSSIYDCGPDVVLASCGIG